MLALLILIIIFVLLFVFLTYNSLIKAKNRIDGFMAELCAYIALMLHEEEYKANL